MIQADLGEVNRFPFVGGDAPGGSTNGARNPHLRRQEPFPDGGFVGVPTSESGERGETRQFSYSSAGARGRTPVTAFAAQRESGQELRSGFPYAGSSTIWASFQEKSNPTARGLLKKS